MFAGSRSRYEGTGVPRIGSAARLYGTRTIRARVRWRSLRTHCGILRRPCTLGEYATNDWTARLPYILTYSNLAVRIPLVYKTFRRLEAGGHWSRLRGRREGEGSWKWRPPLPAEGGGIQGRQTLLLSTARAGAAVLLTL